MLMKIKDIVENFDSKRKPLNSNERGQISKEKKYPYYGANGILDYIDDYIFDDELLCVAEDGGNWNKFSQCSYIVNGKCWINNHAHVLKPKPGINIKYLMHYLNYMDISKKISGAVVPKLTQKSLNDLEIEIPDLETQNKIVEQLDDIELAITNRKEAISLQEKLINSLYDRIFKGESTIKTLSDICEKITDGSHNPPKGSEQKTEYFMLSSQNIINNVITMVNARYISEEDFLKENKRTNIKPGDILLTIVGTVGRTSIVPENIGNITVQRSVAVLKPKTEIDSLYLNYALKNDFVFSQIQNNSKGVAQKGIYLQDLKKIKIKVPDWSSQENFSGKAQIINQEIDLLKKDVEKLNELLKIKMEESFN